jgi:hypothetical protein
MLSHCQTYLDVVDVSVASSVEVRRQRKEIKRGRQRGKVEEQRGGSFQARRTSKRFLIL